MEHNFYTDDGTFGAESGSIFIPSTNKIVSCGSRGSKNDGKMHCISFSSNSTDWEDLGNGHAMEIVKKNSSSIAWSNKLMMIVGKEEIKDSFDDNGGIM